MLLAPVVACRDDPQRGLLKSPIQKLLSNTSML